MILQPQMPAHSQGRRNDLAPSPVVFAGSDSSSVFLSSSDDDDVYGEGRLAPPIQAAVTGCDCDAAPSVINNNRVQSGEPSLVSVLTPNPDAASSYLLQPAMGVIGLGRLPSQAGPFLWRLFPRCIRTSSEEVCIAAEVTLNMVPSECQVTVLKEGVKLPARLEFLNDRQAVGDDADQHGRRGRSSARGAMQAIADWQRRAGRGQMNHVLRYHRHDSELVLIWVTPGMNPGLMLIELHAAWPTVSNGGGARGTGAYASAPPRHAAASMGALEATWRSPHVLAGATTGLRGIDSVLMAAAGWPEPQQHPVPDEAPPVSAAAEDSNGSTTHALTRGAVRPAPAEMVTTQPAQPVHPFFFSMPGSGINHRDAREPGSHNGQNAVCSSGALTVVVVPDVGMEAEVCALLAMQHQQLPLPVTGSGREAVLDAISPPVPMPQQPQQQSSPIGGVVSVAELVPLGAPRMFSSEGQQHNTPLGMNDGAGARMVGANADPHTGFRSCEGAAVEGMIAELAEDNDDAGARERFLWDLGVWLESSVLWGAARAQAGARLAEVAVSSPQPAEGDGPFEQRHSDQMQQMLRQQLESPHDTHRPHLQQGQQPQQQQQRSQRVLGESRRLLGQVGSAGEIEAVGEALHEPWVGSGSAWSHLRRSESRTLAALSTAAAALQPIQEPMSRASLELLGFACSRGWPATSTHIILGLMDIGHSMRDINAAVHGAHGWSALHLAVASGSVELVAMTALWRSYQRYGDGPAVQEEWRAMLAEPGPGGLTPLHLAAVLPPPATAALDLLSTLPAETLNTWFSEAACDGCTPAHYASRAGNTHLNDHALLCLAIGTAALDLGTAQGLQEVIPNLSELQTDATGTESAVLDGGTPGPMSFEMRSSVDCGDGGPTAAIVTTAAAAAASLIGGSLVHASSLTSPPPSSPYHSLSSSFDTASQGSRRVIGEGQACMSRAQVQSTDTGAGALHLIAAPNALSYSICSSSGHAGSSDCRGWIAPEVPGPLPRLSSANSQLPRDSATGGSCANSIVNGVSGDGVAASGDVTSGVGALRPPVGPEAPPPTPLGLSRPATRSPSLLMRLLIRLTSQFQCFGGAAGAVQGDDREGEREVQGRAWVEYSPPSEALSVLSLGPSRAGETAARSRTQEEATPPGSSGDHLQQQAKREQQLEEQPPLPRLLELGSQEGCRQRAVDGGGHNKLATAAALSLANAGAHCQDPPQIHAQPQHQSLSHINQEDGSPASLSVPINTATLGSGCGTGPAPSQLLPLSTAAADIGSQPPPTSASSGSGVTGSSGSSPSVLQLRRAWEISGAVATPPAASTHESPAPPSRSPDRSALCSEPWSSPKGSWSDATAVVTELLGRISPGTSIHGSADSGVATFNTATSHQRSAIGNWHVSSVLWSASGARDASHGALASMTAKQTRMIAEQIVAAAVVSSRDVSCSETALTGEKAAEVANPLTRSAPAMTNRVLMGILHPQCGATRPRLLRQQALDHQERVGLQLQQIMQARLGSREPRTSSQPQPQLPWSSSQHEYQPQYQHRGSSGDAGTSRAVGPCWTGAELHQQQLPGSMQLQRRQQKQQNMTESPQEQAVTGKMPVAAFKPGVTQHQAANRLILAAAAVGASALSTAGVMQDETARGTTSSACVEGSGGRGAEAPT